MERRTFLTSCTIPGLMPGVSRVGVTEASGTFELVSAFDFIPGSEHGPIRARTSTTDVTGWLQTAIDYARANSRALFLPAGKYRITNTLWLTTTAFQTMHLWGEGRGYDASGALDSNQAQTQIEVMQADRPGLAIQYGRGVVVRHLALYSGNDAPDAVMEPTANQADYVTAGYRTDRYSPHCAICLDPSISSTPPGGGYPGFTYHGNAEGSADILLENIGIRNFVVGIMCSPDDRSAQGDRVSIINPSIFGCDVGVSWGQSQARVNAVFGGNVGRCRIAFSGLDHGRRTGPPPRLDGVQYGVVYALWRFDSSLGRFLVLANYAEQFKTLGIYGEGAATARLPLVIEASEFSFGNVGWTHPPFILESQAPVMARGSQFSDKIDWRNVFNIVGAGDVTFEGCAFQASASPAETLYIAHNPDLLPSRARFRDCVVSPQGGGAYELDDEPHRSFGLPARFRATAQTRGAADGADRYLYRPGHTNTARGIPAFGYGFSGTELAFTTDHPEYLIAGDILLWRILQQIRSVNRHVAPALRVTSITGGTVTCNLLFPRAAYDETYAPGSILLAVPEWAPGQTLTGDVTEFSRTLANVNPTGLLEVGDWLAGSSGIPTDARVTVISASTVEISKPATATVAGVALYWGRLHILTTAPAF